ARRVSAFSRGGSAAFSGCAAAKDASVPAAAKRKGRKTGFMGRHIIPGFSREREKNLFTRAGTPEESFAGGLPRRVPALESAGMF
ncbi:MAG TPA: hypothetical protein IAC75_03815, partial [Candidatus Spyradosoma merdigallinarum]|nr:hypothetical protein [Candidatus Spyradosoma merdigallinarum]